MSIDFGLVAYSVVALIPGLFFAGMAYTYRRPLVYKQSILQGILEKDRTRILYQNAHFLGGKKEDTGVSRLFNLFYAPQAYILPSLGCLVVGTLMASILLAKLEAGLPVSAETQLILKDLPMPILAGLIGAYLWAAYDILIRFRSNDLTPTSLHSVWLRMLVAGSLGYVLTFGTTSGVGVAGAFLIGVFPLDRLQKLAEGEAKKRFEVTDESRFEKPKLHELQGSSKPILRRLEEEGISSVQHLAFSDPLRLMLKTNIGWKAVIDLIDQAHLHVHLGGHVASLRSAGVRGSATMADVGEALKSGKPDVVTTARLMLAEVSARTEIDIVSLESLARRLASDPQAGFIRELKSERSISEETS